MAASSIIGALRVNLGLDSARFSSGLKKSKDQLGGFQKDILAIGAKIGGALAAALSIRAIGQAADAWSDMSSRVGVAIGNMQAAPEVMERIHKIAQMTYSPLQQTADGFAENNAALKGLGYTTNQTLDYTEALNNALVVSGAKGDRAASVARALSVALATGKLSGDGLNSVLSNGGEIAELLAKELGTSRNGLIAMAKQGKITGDVIVKALIDNMDELREKAADMPATIADGFQRIGNSFTGLIGRMDQASGASATVAAALVGISDMIDSLAAGMVIAATAISGAVQYLAGLAGSVASAVGEMTGLGSVLTYVSGAFGDMRGYVAAAALAVAAYFTPAFFAATVQVGALVAGLITLRGALIATGIGAIVVVVGTLINKIIDAVKITGSLGGAFRLMGEVASGVWDGIVAAARGIPAGLSWVWEQIKASFYGMLAGLSRSFAEWMMSLGRAVSGAVPQLALGFYEAAGAGYNASIDFYSSAGAASVAAAEAGSAASGALSEGMTIAGEALSKLNVTVETATESLGGEGGGGGLGGALDSTGGKAGGAGKKLSKLQEVMKSLKEQAEMLRATMGMTDLQAAIWGKQNEAGVSAASAQGQQIASLMNQIDAMERLKDATEKGRDAFEGLFGSMLDGADAAKKAIVSLISEMAKVQFTKGMMGLLGGTSWGKSLIGGVGNLLSFDGGGSTGNGPRTGGLDGKGGFLAMMHPRETVIDHTRGQTAGGGSIQMTASQMTLTDDGQIMATVRAEMSKGFASADRALPARVQQIQNKPRMR